jgi:hypothetical protein
MHRSLASAPPRNQTPGEGMEKRFGRTTTVLKRRTIAHVPFKASERSGYKMVVLFAGGAKEVIK